MRKIDLVTKLKIIEERLNCVSTNCIKNLDDNEKTAKIFTLDRLDPIEREILHAVKRAFPQRLTYDVLIEYSECFDKLIKDLEIYDKISRQCEFTYNDKKIEEIADKKVIDIKSLVCTSHTIEHIKTRHYIALETAYVYLHALLDGFLLDAINIFLRVSNEQSYQEEFDKMSAKFTIGRILFFIKNGVIAKKTRDVWFDDFILFYQIRNAIVHSNGVIDEERYKQLRTTRHAKHYTIGVTVVLNEKYLDQWVNNIGWIANEIYKGLIALFPNDII